MTHPEDDVHRHLSDAIQALARCLVDAGPARAPALVDVARLLTAAHQRLAGPPTEAPGLAAAESDDERIERQAAEAADDEEGVQYEERSDEDGTDAATAGGSGLPARPAGDQESDTASNGSTRNRTPAGSNRRGVVHSD